MDDGRIVEMQTGEGKTLAAVLPAALNALTGNGVHVLTFNDYLARRDAGWMGPVYRWLGPAVAFVQEGMAPARRRRPTRGRHLRHRQGGGLRSPPRRLARSSRRAGASGVPVRADRRGRLDPDRRGARAAGHRRHGRSRGVLFALASRIVTGLTRGPALRPRRVWPRRRAHRAGAEHIERLLGCGSLHVEANLPLLTEINCALHAHTLLRRDVDYLVRDGRIAIIDEHTGRVVDDRHWPDGLQAALEAKEGLDRRPDGRILGSITLQHFIRRLPAPVRDDGDGDGRRRELDENLRREVTVIPTHRPMIRVDHPDRVFGAARRRKRRSSRRSRRRTRPGVRSSSARSASRNRSGSRRGWSRRVSLRRAERAERRGRSARHRTAGAPGAVTISTNMAGRGTDIRLGEPGPGPDTYSVAPGSSDPGASAAST